MITLLNIDSTAVSFGIFEQLSNYGALGLAVLALGYVAWYLVKRQLDENKRLQDKIDQLQDGEK
jgi:hypothetical protein